MSRAFEALLALAVLLYVASWPGIPTRPLTLELVAAPLPATTADRDGVLDVIAQAREGEAPEDPTLPLAGVRVRAFAILDGVAHGAGEATSDGAGRATLRALPHVEHWIVAEAEGRARASQMVAITGGERRLDLVLGPEHHLDVEVKAEDGPPLRDAEIEIRGTDPFPVGARTGEGGRVRAGRLGAGPFTVTVRAPGFEEVTRRRVPEGSPCVVTLGRQGAMMVTVVDESGKPAAGARVLVASPSLWPARAAETRADGTVRLGGLDPGSYALRAVQGTRASPIEVGVTVGRGEEKAVELRLAPGVMVAARVVDAVTDDGVPRARVTLAEAGLSPFPIEALTDKAGRAVLGPIAHGGATLVVRADGFVARAAVRVEDPYPGEIAVRLVRGGALIGRVVDARGYAVDGAVVRVVGTDLEGLPIDEDPQRAAFREAHFQSALEGPRPLVPSGELGVVPGPVPAIPRGPALGLALGPGAGPSGASASSASEPWVTARDGTFRATPIAPGRVRALVRHPQYVEAMSEVVTLASEKEARVDVVLSRGGTLEGRVVDVRGRPVAGAHVTALALKGSLERMTRAGTDGSFAFASLPDAVAILVSRDEDAAQVVAARIEVSVPDAGKKTVEVVLPETRPPLPVRVTTDRGQAVDAAQISAVSLDPAEGLRATAFTDPRGAAELPSARGLALRVEIRAPGRAAKVMTTTAETSSLAVELPSAESLTGEVRANRRESVEGAEITLHTEAGVRRGRSDKEGSFTVGDLPAGPARLRVRAKGRAPFTREVVIEDRGGRRPTTIPRIELAEEGVVEGSVVDAKGDPIPGARVARDAVPTYLPVGTTPAGMAVSDPRGRFRLGELPEGNLSLEAYAPDVGRARAVVRVIAGRTTEGLKIVLLRDGATVAEPLATGGVAVTLGETAAGLDRPEVVIVAVSEGSEAERAGLSVHDVVLAVGGQPVESIGAARARLAGPVRDDVVVKLRRGERLLTLRVSREAVRR